MSDAQAADDPVGSLGEEAVKLLSALSTWAQDHTGGEPSPTAGERACSCASPVACHWCPVCQAVAAVRAASPELKDQLVSSGLALTAAARLFLEALAAPTAPGPAPEVERIDLSDDGGSQPWD
jgi:hypothetical protein